MIHGALCGGTYADPAFHHPIYVACNRSFYADLSHRFADRRYTALGGLPLRRLCDLHGSSAQGEFQAADKRNGIEIQDKVT